MGFQHRYNFKSDVHSIWADIADSKLLCVGGRVEMIGFLALKIMTTVVLAFLTIATAWVATKQKTASDGVTIFACAMFLAFGIAFMWV